MYFSQQFIQKIYCTGFFLVIILVIIDLLTFFCYPNLLLSEIFLATKEQTPLTWISSLTFLFIALSCLSVYLERRKKLWLFLSIIFAFFSVDDATYIHERLSGFLASHTEILNTFPTYIWVVLYGPLLVFSLGAIIWLLWKKISLKNKKMIIVALVFLGVAICLDLTDGLIQKKATLIFCLDKSCYWSFLHLLRLTEEVLEVFALGILGYIIIQTYCLAPEQK